jgi:hypothetical protein
MIANGVCDSECITEECSEDYPDCISYSSAFQIFVTNEARSSIGTGSRTSPYTSLYNAFLRTYSTTAIFYLLKGEHHLKFNPGQSFSYPLNRSYKMYTITITTALCLKEPTLQGCGTENATIFVDDIISIYSSVERIYIVNVNIRGDNLVCRYATCKDCSSQKCKYCPYADVLSSGNIISDRLEEVRYEEYQLYGKNCDSLFGNYDFIYVGEGISLTLINVKFSNFLAGQSALIKIWNTPIVTFISVEFERIIPSNLKGNAVIVLVADSGLVINEMTFKYRSGSVKYINDGYEINPVLRQGGFLYISTVEILLNIQISEVNFSFNIHQNQFTSILTLPSFIYILTWEVSVVFKDLIFSNNYASLGLINIYTYQRYGDSTSYMRISNLHFFKNSSKHGIFKFSAAYFNIYVNIHQLKFEKCVSTDATMILLKIYGEHIENEKQEKFFQDNRDSLLFGLRDVTISNCYSKGSVLNVEGFYNMQVYNLNIEDSGDSNQEIEDLINEYTLNDFLGLGELNLKYGNRSPYEMICDRLVYFNYMYRVKFMNSKYSGNSCKTDTAILISRSPSVYIKNITIQDITVDNEGMTGLLRVANQQMAQVIVRDCIFKNIHQMSGMAGLGIYTMNRGFVLNVIFKDMKTGSLGSLLGYQVKKIRIESCNFENIDSSEGMIAQNNVESSSGIGIFACDEIEILDCEFNNLKSYKSASALRIDVSNASLVSNLNFYNTESTSLGAFAATRVMQIEIESCIFDNVLSKQGDGAGVYIETTGDKINTKSVAISSTTFNRCLTDNGLGCIHIKSDDQLIMKAMLNTLTFTKARGKSGSAIYIHSTVYLSEAVFSSIRVTENYNILNAPIHSEHRIGILHIKDSTFTQNAGAGAAISSFFRYPGNLLNLSNLSIENNNCNVSGINLESLSNLSKVNTQGLRISNNSCIGIKVSQTSIADDNSTFLENSSAIHIENNAIMDMTNAIISRNYSRDKGGGVHVLVESRFMCKNCKIVENRAKAGAGLMIEQDSVINLISSQVANNYAEESGSGIYIIASGKLISEIVDCDIEGNISELDSSVRGVVSSLYIKDSRIRNNMSYTSTPGIILNYSKLTLLNTTIQYHNSTSGALIYSQTGSEVKADGCIFEYASATKGGGAVAAFGSTLEFTGSVFQHLYSDTNSAGILLSALSYVTVYNCEFYNLTSKSDGSLFYSVASSITLHKSSFRQFEKVGISGNALDLLEIKSSHFIEGAGDYGGAILCEECKQIYIIDTIFENNSALFLGGALYLTSSSNDEGIKYKIESSKFYYNTADMGGAIYIDGGNVDIIGSYLENNQGISRGGAIYILCSESDVCDYKMSNNNFIYNTAGVAGGAIHWDGSKPNIDSSNIFLDNLGDYGYWNASYPIRMQLIEEGHLIQYSQSSIYYPQAYTLDDVPPGQTLTQILNIALVDHYNQVYSLDNSSFATILEVESTVILGSKKVVASEGIFTFDNIQILAQPNSTVYIQILSPAIHTSKEEEAHNEDKYYSSIFIKINLRECMIGESDLGNQCKICDKGTYSLDTEQECNECPQGAYCLGNFTMYPRENYWRTDRFSDIFYECPNKNACLGSSDYESFEGECEEGYTGNMCQPCENGYFHSLDDQCTKCLDDRATIMMSIGISSGIFLYCFFMVRATLIASYTAKSLNSMYIKIFTNYLQLVGISVGLNIPWPQSLLDFFNIHESSSKSTERAFSFDCYLMNSDTDSYTQIYYKKMIIMLFMPIIFAFFCIIIWSIIALRKKNMKYLKVELVATIVIIFFYMHPNLTSVFLSVYSCREIEGEGYFLELNLDVECWTEGHLQYALGVGLPGIIIWVLGVPLGIMMFIGRNYKHLRDIQMKLRFGFLYGGYRYTRSYWEIVLLMRNVNVIMIIVFLSRFSVDLQALSCLLVMLIAYYIHVLVLPYKHANLNELERKGILTSAITIYFGLYFLKSDVDETAKLILFLVIFIANIYFMMIWAYYFLEVFTKEMIDKVDLLKKLFKKGDDFDSQIYCESSATEQVYLEEEEKIITLISPDNSDILAISAPERMTELYTKVMKNQYYNLDFENLTNRIYFTEGIGITDRTICLSDSDPDN